MGFQYQVVVVRYCDTLNPKIIIPTIYSKIGFDSPQNKNFSINIKILRQDLGYHIDS